VLRAQHLDGDAADMEDGHRVVCFDTPDAAYLVAAALRQRPDASRYDSVVLIPTDHGPSLEIPLIIADDPVVTQLVELFEGALLIDGADGNAGGPGRPR
jgi:hypothetical protein